MTSCALMPRLLYDGADSRDHGVRFLPDLDVAHLDDSEAGIAERAEPSLVGFTVEDRDRAKGLYYVRYIDPEAEAAGKAAKPGFFGRLFSRSASAAPAQQYRVRLAAAGDVTRVTVLSRDGQPLASELDQRTGQRILALLREQLQQ